MTKKTVSSWIVPCFFAAFLIVGPGWKDSGVNLKGSYGELRQCSERARVSLELGGEHWLDASAKLTAAYHTYAAEALRAMHWAAVLVIAKILADVLAASEAGDALKKRVSKPS